MPGSQYVVEVEPVGISMDWMWSVRERRVKDYSKYFDPSCYQDKVTIF